MGRRRAIAAFLLVSVCFGGTFVAARAAQPAVPPLLLVAVRFDLAAVLLFGYAALTHPRAALVPRTRGDLAGILAAGVFAIGGANALLFVGQGGVPSAVGAIIFSLVPIFSPIFAAALLEDERLSASGVVGTLLGLVGVALVIGVDPANLADAVDPAALALLAGAASAALGGVLVRRADATTSSTVRTAWALPIAALALHAASALAGESIAAAEWTPTAVASLAFLAVFAGAAAYVAYFDLIETVGPIRASLTSYASPVVATLGGWHLLSEPLPASAGVGFAVIVLGFAILGADDLRTAVRGWSAWRSLVGTDGTNGDEAGSASDERYTRRIDTDGD